MYLNFLDSFGKVQNKDLCIRLIYERAKGMKIKNKQKLVMEINKKVSRKSVCCYDKDYNKVSPSEEICVYKWVNLGLKDSKNADLFAQFIRTPDNEYVGCKIGTFQEIIDYNNDNPCEMYKPREEVLIVEETSTTEKVLVTEDVVSTILQNIVEDESEKVEIKVSEEQTSEKISINTADDGVSKDSSKRTSVSCEKSAYFYKSLYDRLLIKEGWDLDEPTLRNYIELIITRLNYLEQNGKLDNKTVTYSSNKAYVLFNSGLLDKFGNDIYVFTDVLDKGYFSYTEMRLVDGKSHLSSIGFNPNKLNINLLRVNFFDKESDRCFNAGMDEIDLNSFVRIRHCVEERRNRFPDEFKSLSTEALSLDVIKAVELGVHINEIDKSYIKPMYNMKYNSIHYIIPYHVGGVFTNKPQLGIILAKNADNYWQLMTILEYNECINNIRSISMYSNNSF